MDEPSPAPASMTTWWPPRTSSCTPAGVIATRYSWFLISRGIPTFIRCLSVRRATGSQSRVRLGQDGAQDLLHLVELSLPVDQRRGELDDGVTAVVRAAVETGVV